MRPGVRLTVDGEGLLRDGEKSQQYGAYGSGESRVKRTEHEEEFFRRVGFSAQRKDLHMHAKPAESAFGTQNRQREFARRGKAAARDLGKQHQGGQNSFVRNKSRGTAASPEKSDTKAQIESMASAQAVTLRTIAPGSDICGCGGRVSGGSLPDMSFESIPSGSSEIQTLANISAPERREPSIEAPTALTQKPMPGLRQNEISRRASLRLILPESISVRAAAAPVG